MTFDPHDPEIVALMNSKAEAQTIALMQADERLQRYPNFDPERMRAVARAADPTSILDEPEPIQFTGPRTVTFQFKLDDEQYQRLAAAFGAAAEIVNEIVQATSDAFSKFAAKIADLEPDVSPRLRHGHAAVCPKHGPTRGGFCRRCAR